MVIFFYGRFGICFVHRTLRIERKKKEITDVIVIQIRVILKLDGKLFGLRIENTGTV